MAKNSPSFPFYPSDFLVGTMHFTAEEIGVYTRLLCYQWTQTKLDDDEEKLAKLACVSVDDFRRIWKTVADKFDKGEDGYLRNPRMAVDIARKRAISRTNAINGRRGGEANAKRSLSERGSERLATSLPVASNSLKRTPSEPDDDWIFPDGWNVNERLRKALDDWAQMRKDIRKPLRSKAATSKQFKHFDGPDHLQYCAEFCEANQYQGLKPDYRPSTGKNRFQRPDIRQEMEQMERL